MEVARPVAVTEDRVAGTMEVQTQAAASNTSIDSNHDTVDEAMP